MLARHGNLLRAAAENVARNSRGYAVAVSGLVAGLAPLLAGIAVSEGLKEEALASVEAGADVYVTWDAFGRDAPVARERIAELERLEGVLRAVPRIIGRVPLGEEWAVLLGVPRASWEGRSIPVEGELPGSAEEVLVGHELARALGLGRGSTIALEGETIRLFTVAGIASATSSLWSAKAVICDLEEAAFVFGEGERVSDVCLYTRPGYADLVAEAVERLDEGYRVQTKGLVQTYVFRGMSLREGVFTVLFVLALALAIPSFAVLTYMGHTPRRRAIGILKAEGWRTSDVIEMVAFENLITSLLAAALALFLALLWGRVFGAPWIAPFFVSDLGAFPEMEIPMRFQPLPAVLAFVLSIVVTMTGSILTTWRTAVTRPVEVLR